MNIFGEVVHTYTREQAMADGALIDVSQAAKEAGFRLPMAVTASVWADAVAWDGSVEEECCDQDESGRLWDLLFMAHHAAVRAREGADRITFSWLRIPRGGREAEEVSAILHIGPGDGGEPVLTVMFPEDD